MSLIENVNIFLLLVYILYSNNEDKRINENKLKIDTEELHEIFFKMNIINQKKKFQKTSNEDHTSNHNI